jgi:hypothetical protein
LIFGSKIDNFKDPPVVYDVSDILIKATIRLTTSKNEKIAKGFKVYLNVYNIALLKKHSAL